MKKMLFAAFLLPIVSFAQKNEPKTRDTIKSKEIYEYNYRYYNVTPCYCPTTIELLEKLKNRKNQFTNPYKFTEKDTLKIKSKDFFL